MHPRVSLSFIGRFRLAIRGNLSQILLAALLVFIGQASLAHADEAGKTSSKNKIVTGTVTSESGTPLPGATVQVKNSKTATTTDDKGAFSLDVPDNAILVVSYVGYQSREISVSGVNSVSVKSHQQQAHSMN